MAARRALMVAYSFKRQFVEPIRAGTKRQTIRAERQRHARPGEEVQLYTGMRTRQCRLIGRATCTAVTPIGLYFGARPFTQIGGVDAFGLLYLDIFAQADGFMHWADLVAFWRANHPDVGDVFAGILVQWGDLEVDLDA
jgi:hypothetical protein